MTHDLVYRTELTPLLFLERSADVFREKPAVIYRQTSYTYPELRARVRRLASALAGVGVEKGDRVAIICPNIPPMLEAHYGIPLAGATMVPINTRLSSDEIAYILNHSGAKVLLIDTELSPVVARVLDQLETVKLVVSIVDRELGADAAPATLAGPEYEAFLATGSEAPIAIPVEDEYETISINYTSGTTGRPKGVMVHHRGAYLNAIGECMTSGIVSTSRYLWTLPMFHCNGWCCTWGVTAVGAAHVCLRRVEPGEIWRLILEEGVTHLNGAPTVLIGLVNHPAAKTAKLSQPLRVTTAAAPPSPSIIGQMQALGAEITHVYGLTETYGPHTVCEWQEQWNELPPEEQARKKARQGVGYQIAEETRVVDETCTTCRLTVRRWAKWSCAATT